MAFLWLVNRVIVTTYLSKSKISGVNIVLANGRKSLCLAGGCFTLLLGINSAIYK